MSLLKLLDLLMLAAGFLLTTILVVEAEHAVSLGRFFSLRTRVVNFGLFLLALVIFHINFRASGLYRSRRLSTQQAEAIDVLKAMGLNAICFAAFSWVFAIRMITAKFLAIFWIFATLFLLLSRLVLRRVAAYLRSHGRDLRHLLILGTNSRAIEFAGKVASDPERGYRVLGFVDDDWPGIGGVQKTGLRVVSDFAGMAAYLRANVVDEVAMYLPVGSFYRHSAEVVKLCEQHGITMRFNSDIFDLKTLRWHAEEFEGQQHIATYSGSVDLWPRAVKRMLDIVVSASALVLLSPVLAAAAVAIKLTSAGNIFFLQERIGRNKRRFKIYKFRTMVANAENLMPSLEAQNEAGGPVFKMRNDPRITKLGRFLRKSSIDELPQLLNVLRGEMSLVGPRPLPVRDYNGFSEDWQRRRFSVKPGITCLWQVNGRSGVSFDQWMLLDLQYLDEWSLWLDLKILAKTVPAVIRGEGAA